MWIMQTSNMDSFLPVPPNTKKEAMSSNLSNATFSDQTHVPQSHVPDINNSNSVLSNASQLHENINNSTQIPPIYSGSNNEQFNTASPGLDISNSNTPKSGQTSSNKIRRSRPDAAPPLDETLKEISTIIQRCMKETIKVPNIGVPFDEMLHWFKTNDAPIELTNPATLEVAINREMQYVKIKQLENGNYALAKKRGRPFGTGLLGLKRTNSGNHSRPSFGDYARPPKKQRHSDGARHKHSPSNHATTPKTSTAAEHPNPSTTPKSKGDTPICDFCLQTAAANRKGHYEALLLCKDCPARAHPTCMNYNDILARRAALSPWQCIDCKTCCLCLDAGDPDGLLFCDSCDKGYHMTCHEPSLGQKPNNKWACTTCLKAGVNIDDIIADSNQNQNQGASGDHNDSVFVETTPRSLVNGDENHRRNNNQLKSNKDLPSSVRDWTRRHVRTYIIQCGFPKEAVVFFEQEIDGQSLLLLQRQDILRSMNFKLGPALKISEKIKLLQSGSRYPPIIEN